MPSSSSTTPPETSPTNPQGIKPGDIVILQRLRNTITGQELRPQNLRAHGEKYLETIGQTYEVSSVIHDSLVELINPNYDMPLCHLVHCVLSKKAEERPRYYLCYNDDYILIKEYIYTPNDPNNSKTLARIDKDCPTHMLQHLLDKRNNFTSPDTP